MVSVCPVWQHGQSFSVFTFSTRGVVDLAEAFLLVRDFQNAFRRGSSSSSSTSTNKISIYEDSLFKRGGFPCLRSLASEHPTTLFPPLQLPTADYGGTGVWQVNILLHFFLPFNYQLPIMVVPRFPERFQAGKFQQQQHEHKQDQDK